MLKQNQNPLAILKAKFKPANPDTLPAGEHQVVIYEMGVSDPDSDPITDRERAKERGYEDTSFLVTVIMGNERGRVMRKFAISGFERYEEAKKNLAFWNAQVDHEDLGMTKEAWKKLKPIEKFEKAFRVSDDGKGYLVFNHVGGAFRVQNERRRESAIEIFNKFIGGCDPSYQARECDNIVDWFVNICNDMKGKSVGITVRENEDGSLEVTSKFRTVKA